MKWFVINTCTDSGSRAGLKPVTNTGKWDMLDKSPLCFLLSVEDVKRRIIPSPSVCFQQQNDVGYQTQHQKPVLASEASLTYFCRRQHFLK